jgi:hypothetical protein
MGQPGQSEQLAPHPPVHKNLQTKKRSNSIIKRLGSLNTTIYFDIIKEKLYVSARGHRQVGSFGFARKKCFLQRPVNLQ